MDLNLVLLHAPLLLLNLIRVAAFFFAAPLFSAQRESRLLRIILGVSLGSFFWWVNTDWTSQILNPLEIRGLLDFAAMAIREGVIGLLAGFSLRAIVTVLSVAGEILAHEMGFSMSRVLNPVTGTSSTSMAQLFEIMAYLLLFQLNLHHQFLRVIESTFSFVPIGQGFNFAIVYMNLHEMLRDALEFGLMYAAPIFAVMILLTVTLVVLSRAVQNINLMEFSFGMRILLALVASIYFLEEGSPFLERVFVEIFTGARLLFAGA